MSAAKLLALVTGAGSGIGRATAVAFSKLPGVTVVAADINLEGAKETAKLVADARGACLPLSVDVADEPSVVAMMEEVKGKLGGHSLAYSFLNAGVEGDEWRPFWQTSTSDFDKTLAINTRGVFLCLKHNVPAMLQAAERGVKPSIVLTSSIAGQRGMPNTTAYCASKHAILGMMKSAAMDLQGKVRINAIAPGFVMTPLMARAAAKSVAASGPPATPLDQAIPMGRLGTPEEIAAAVVWMSQGEGSSYLHGSTLTADGGFLAGFRA